MPATAGFSPAAQMIDVCRRNVTKDKERVVTFARASTIDAIWRAGRDVDGGMQPVDFKTMLAAADFISLIPEGIRMPEVTAEENGCLSFEWYRANRRVVWVSIQGSSFHWSALIGDDAPRGKFEFRPDRQAAIPLSLQMCIGRVTND